MSTQVVNVLEQELRALDEQKLAISRLLDQYRGLHLARSPQAVKKTAPRKTAPKNPSTPIRPKQGKNEASTMEMVRQALSLNHGQHPEEPEMTPGEIRAQILHLFGPKVHVAKSMTQMIYKRSRDNNTFYRNKKTGKYGLLTWRSPQPKAA